MGEPKVVTNSILKFVNVKKNAKLNHPPTPRLGRGKRMDTDFLQGKTEGTEETEFEANLSSARQR